VGFDLPRQRPDHQRRGDAVVRAGARIAATSTRPRRDFSGTALSTVASSPCSKGGTESRRDRRTAGRLEDERLLRHRGRSFSRQSVSGSGGPITRVLDSRVFTNPRFTALDRGDARCSSRCSVAVSSSVSTCSSCSCIRPESGAGLIRGGDPLMIAGAAERALCVGALGSEAHGPRRGLFPVRLRARDLLPQQPCGGLSGVAVCW